MNIDRTQNILPQVSNEYDSQHNIANLYNTAVEYHAGDYVIYQADLYKCLADCSGAWDAAKWDKITISSQLTEGFKITSVTWTVTEGIAYANFYEDDTLLFQSSGLELPDLQSLIGSSAIGTSSTGVYYDGTAFRAVTPEHWTSHNVISGLATGTTNTPTTNTNTYLNHTEDGVVVDSHKIVGAGTVSVASDVNGVLTITGEGGSGGGLEADPYKLEVTNTGIHMEKDNVDFGLFADASLTVPKVVTKTPGATGPHYSIFEDVDGSLVFTVE